MKLKFNVNFYKEIRFYALVGMLLVFYLYHLPTDPIAYIVFPIVMAVPFYFALFKKEERGK